MFFLETAGNDPLVWKVIAGVGTVVGSAVTALIAWLRSRKKERAALEQTQSTTDLTKAEASKTDREAVIMTGQQLLDLLKQARELHELILQLETDKEVLTRRELVLKEELESTVKDLDEIREELKRCLADKDCRDLRVTMFEFLLRAESTLLRSPEADALVTEIEELKSKLL